MGVELSYNDIHFIKANIDTMTFIQLAQQLNIPVCILKKRAYKLGIKRGNRHKFTAEDDAYLIENFSNKNNDELAEYLKASVSGVSQRGSYLGLKKSKELIQQLGFNLCNHPASVTTRLKMGNIPPNKGLKMEEFMALETIEKFKKNQFKEGHKPHNTKYDGYERTDVNGYVWVRISEKNWAQKHRIVWENYFGKIPSGTNIQFRDCNRQNCAIENLYAITREEQMKDNSVLNYPPEVQTTFRLMGKINKIIKNQENEKTN